MNKFISHNYLFTTLKYQFINTITKKQQQKIFACWGFRYGRISFIQFGSWLRFYDCRPCYFYILHSLGILCGKYNEYGEEVFILGDRFFLHLKFAMIIEAERKVPKALPKNELMDGEFIIGITNILYCWSDFDCLKEGKRTNLRLR